MLEPALELSRAGGIRLTSWLAAGGLGAAYASAGRLLDAVTLLEQAVDDATSMKLEWFRSWINTELAEAYLRAGRIEDATEQTRSLLAVCEARKERGARAWALRLLGEIAAHRDPLQATDAEQAYRQALTLADEFGMRPLVAHCHLGLGKLSGRTGRPGQAQEHLTTATTMYREMDMRFWLEQAEAEMKGLA